MAVFQPEGGFLLPERCIVAHVELAQAAGAEVRARERVVAVGSRRRGRARPNERGEYAADGSCSRAARG